MALFIEFVGEENQNLLHLEVLGPLLDDNGIQGRKRSFPHSRPHLDG